MNEQARTNPGMIKELSVLKQRIQELEHSESGRKQVDEELRESEERFRTLSDMTPLGMSLIDIDGRYEYLNPAFVKIFGYDLPDIPTGKEWFRTAYPDPEYRRKVMADWKEDLSSFPKLQIKPRIYEVRCKEGDFRTILFRTVTLPTGKHLIIYEDITESKRVAESNRRESLFRQSIIDNATEGICVCHDVSEFPYTRFTVWNNHMNNITGYTREEINFQGWYQSVYPDPEIQAKASARMARMRQGDNLHQDEWEITRKDGQRRQLLISTCIVPGGETGVNVLAVMNDITERKRAEEALRESKERYRTLVDNATDIVFRTDNSGHFTFVNPAGIRITGYEEKELIGKHYPTLIRPDMRDEAIKLFGRQFVKGIDNTYTEYPILTKEGHDVWLGQNTQLIVEDGHVTGFQAVSRDITDRKRAEEALRDSESKYQFLAESMADVVFTLDINLVTTYVSPSIERMLGFTPEERVTQKVDQQLTPKSQKLVFEGLIAELDREKEEGADPNRSQTLELEFYHKDGSIKHLVTYIRGMRDSEGNLTGFYGSHHDITDRKRTEETLRLITDNMSDMIRVTDLQGVNLYVSPSHVKILGYTQEERVGKSGFDLIHPDDLEHIFNVFSEGLSNKRPAKVVYRIKHAEGHYIWLETIGDQLKNDQGEMTAVIMSSRDITDRKLAEQQLQDTLESLRKAVGVTIQVLATTVEARDPYTAGHQLKSANLARAIAMEMGLPQEKIDAIRMAGSIHDIGKLSIPAEILSKPMKLSELEFAMIKEHAGKGYEMLKDVVSQWPLAEIIRQHHERMDGSGYPRNLKRDDILIEARILAIADVVESMASHRPYRPALGLNAALEEIEKNKETLYDAGAADACLRLFREKGFQLERT